METGYQRGKIRKNRWSTSTESTTALIHRRPEHLPQSARKSVPQRLELIRSTRRKQSQLRRWPSFTSETRQSVRC